MSDVITEPKVEVEEDKYVSKSAYEEVKKDMFTFKTAKKDLEEKLKQIQAEKEELETSKLMEKEQWKQLYETEANKRKEMESIRLKEKNQFIDYHKKNAVISKIGGFKRDEYNSFIDVSKVEIDESGNILADSLEGEVTRIKQLYPELIKTSNSHSLPSDAPKSFNGSEKEYKNMTANEKQAYKLALTKPK